MCQTEESHRRLTEKQQHGSHQDYIIKRCRKTHVILRVVAIEGYWTAPTLYTTILYPKFMRTVAVVARRGDG
ncbi:hypothetical protein ACHAXS_013323 [Conticribra weissflogii]